MRAEAIEEAEAAPSEQPVDVLVAEIVEISLSPLLAL